MLTINRVFQMTRIIAVLSGKGGVGKTTVCTNLGAVLSNTFRKQVVIVDGNITTSHLSLYLGMYYHPISLNHVLKGKVKMEDAMYEHFSGMKVVPASLSVDDLRGVDILKLKRKLKELFGKSDFVFLDSAPGLGREAIAALEACDEAIFVTTPYIPAVTDIIRCKKVADELGVKILGTVLNMVTRDSHELTRDDIEALTEVEVIGEIPFDKKVLKSLGLKVPVTLLYPKSKVSRELVKVSAKIAGIPYAERKGLYSRLLGFFGKLKRRQAPAKIVEKQEMGAGERVESK